MLVVGEDDHVFPLVAIILDEERREVLGVVDAAGELAVLPEVVDADQQRLALTGTVGILEGIALRGAVAELLRCRGRWRARAMVSSVSLYRRIAIAV